MWQKLLILVLMLIGLTPVADAETVADIETSLGTITIRFHADAAPKTVAQFQRLAQSGWYDGKSFYRVVRGHVIQAGANDDNDPVTRTQTVPAEFNAHPHIRGAVGLARDNDPNSGSTEFYICDAPRPHLDGRYTVFGQVIAGDAVLEAIATSAVEEQWLGDEKTIAFHRPLTPVMIQRIRLREQP